jgi:hypothetical protein
MISEDYIKMNIASESKSLASTKLRFENINNNLSLIYRGLYRKKLCIIKSAS